MDESDNEFEKIKLKFDAIWKARDIELAAVRERTLLAWGFLMFCYGGYGYLVSRILLHEGPVAELRFNWPKEPKHGQRTPITSPRPSSTCSFR